MLRWLLLFTAAMGCLLPAVEYEPATGQTDGPLTPEPTEQCPDAGDCCVGPDCAAEPPVDVVCSALDGGAALCSNPEAQQPTLPLTPVAPAPAATCADQLRNQAETDRDCGGPCGRTCAQGQQCRVDQDCSAGLFCAEATRLCVAPACDDGVRNGDEADIDCGGSCVACPTGSACAAASDCAAAVCGSAGCAAGVALCCQAPSCTDGIQNGNEPALDCGNAGCGLCAVGNACSANQQCSSGLCQQGFCQIQSSCADGISNGQETDVDCGGPDCPRCPDLATCVAASDCSNANCLDGSCISCGDGVADGTETDVDCGGLAPACRRCNPGERCAVNADCVSDLCLGGFC